MAKRPKSAKKLDEVRLAKMRQCIHSQIEAASQNLLPDYRCCRSRVACRLYWSDVCCDHQKFPETYDA